MNIKSATSIDPQQFCGVWSAAPTPFDDRMEVDAPAIQRLAEHHLRLGVKGLFIAGSCGEGPWISRRQLRQLVQETAGAVAGRIPIAVQVTDNSAVRVLENIEMAREDGADLVVIAAPYILRNATNTTLLNFYMEAISKSPLPVIIYDLGQFTSLWISEEIIQELYAAPNVVAVKDSSADPQRMQVALAAREKRPELRLLVGNEFKVDEYIQAGYDGAMLGGAAFQASLANHIIEAANAGDMPRATQLQERMNQLMYKVYGGENAECWLAGEKTLLMKLGVFSTCNNYLGYTLTDTCRRAIEEVLVDEADVLLP